MEFSVTMIKEAQERIKEHVIRTPLIRLSSLDDILGCEVYVKCENLQKTGSFKLRGAMNAILSLSSEEIKRGVVTASSGNHGRAVAYAAKKVGAEATIVIPDTTPQVKIGAIRDLGAQIVVCEASERFRVAEEERLKRLAIMIPPYNDYKVMAGQGTIGLEIAEEGIDFDSVVVPVSGGGLISGVATALKAWKSSVAVYGAEAAHMPRYSKSLAAGERLSVPQQPTIASALVSQMGGELCFPVVEQTVEAVYAVKEETIAKAHKLLLFEGKILAEPSSLVTMAAILEGQLSVEPSQKVCFLVSGGNMGLDDLQSLSWWL